MNEVSLKQYCYRPNYITKVESNRICHHLNHGGRRHEFGTVIIISLYLRRLHTLAVRNQKMRRYPIWSTLSKCNLFFSDTTLAKICFPIWIGLSFMFVFKL